MVIAVDEAHRLKNDDSLLYKYIIFTLTSWFFVSVALIVNFVRIEPFANFEKTCNLTECPAKFLMSKESD